MIDNEDIMAAEIVNARIESTMLGIEDHGIMTFMVTLNYGSSGQGYDGYSFDSYNKETKKRVGNAFGIEAIRSLLEAVGVTCWEDLKGKYVRVEREEGWSGKIYAVGHIVESKWCNLGLMAAEINK